MTAQCVDLMQRHLSAFLFILFTVAYGRIVSPWNRCANLTAVRKSEYIRTDLMRQHIEYSRFANCTALMGSHGDGRKERDVQILPESAVTRIRYSAPRLYDQNPVSLLGWYAYARFYMVTLFWGIAANQCRGGKLYVAINALIHFAFLTAGHMHSDWSFWTANKQQTAESKLMRRIFWCMKRVWRMYFTSRSFLLPIFYRV